VVGAIETVILFVNSVTYGSFAPKPAVLITSSV
jgi:hypothetical protein